MERGWIRDSRGSGTRSSVFSPSMWREKRMPSATVLFGEDGQDVFSSVPTFEEFRCGPELEKKIDTETEHPWGVPTF